MKEEKEEVLSKGFIPYMAKVFPFLNDNFLSKNIIKLESLSLDEVRNLLLSEITSAKELTPSNCNNQLQKIFDKLFSLQPAFNTNKKEREMRDTEQRLYADLVSTPGFLDDPVVRDFLLNNYHPNSKNDFKYICLTQILEMYSKLDEESIEKFNYCFRSSSVFAKSLMYDDRMFNKVLNDRTLSMFNKETFSQLFRFFDENYSTKFVERYIVNGDEKSLFVISQMCEHIYNQVGHTSEFMYAIFSLDRWDENANSNFRNVLIDFYDKVIVDKENEQSFREAIKDGMTFEMREIVNAILDYSYSYDYRNPFNGINTLDEFMDKVLAKRKENHINIFGSEGFRKFEDGIFEAKDFKKIETQEDFIKFKNAFLSNIYGISSREAEFITSRYGHNLEALASSVEEDDVESLCVLRSIVSINNLTIENKEKLSILQNLYYNYMDNHGLNYQKQVNSMLVLEGLFNRMYMNTYNKILLNDLSKKDVLFVDDGVELIDAGVDFNMIVTALNGTTSFFDKGVNIASKWNTAFRDINQGLCTSFISNDNLGVISLDGPVLGFASLPRDCLDTMGTTDIYTYTNNFNLRFNNRKNTPFYVGSQMSNETRFGYNEMLIDRFISVDDEDKVKLQPDYIVFYKTQENYRMSKRYVESLKTAKDFGIPIVVVDYQKIQAHEKEVLVSMEEELFKSDEVDAELLGNIMMRYMNNISGSRTIHGHVRLGGLGLGYDYFPGDALGNFISQTLMKCENVDDKYRLDWINALQSAYDEELRKHMVAIGVNSYNCSLGSDNDRFNLITDYNLGDKLRFLQERYNPTKVVKEDESFRKGDISAEEVVLTNIANTLGFNTTYSFVKMLNYDEEKGYAIVQHNSNLDKTSLEEKIIVAYFTDNYQEDLLEKMNTSKQKLEFGTLREVLFKRMNKETLSDSLKDSYLKDEIGSGNFNVEKLNYFVSKIDELDEKKFLSVFRPIIYKIAGDQGYSYEYIADKFLEKKANIGGQVKELSDILVSSNGDSTKTR